MKIFFVYILKSEGDGNYYTGLTTNLKKRIREHNSSKSNTISTKARGSFKLIYFEIHKSRKEARRREKFCKSGYGREIREQMFENNKSRGGRSSMVERLPVE